MADETSTPVSFNVFEAEHNGVFNDSTETEVAQSPATPVQTPATQGTPQSPAVSQPGGTTQVPGGTQQPPVAPTPGAVTMSQEQLQELVRSINPNQQQQVPQEQAPVLTPQQVDEHYQVVRPTQEQVESLFRGGPESVQTMTNLLHGAAKMGATIASHHLIKQMETLRQELTGQFAPIKQETEQRQVQQHTEAFFQQYGHLKPYEPVLVSVYNQLLASGFRGNPQQVYAKIAEESERLIRNVNPAFVSPAAGQPALQGGAATPAGQPQTQLPKSQMTPLAMGGGSGGANPSSSSGSKNQAESIFG